MNVSKFTAAFKTHTGLSAAAYIRHIRMDQANASAQKYHRPSGGYCRDGGLQTPVPVFHPLS
jgi:AraC-like DNA-binding protein